MSQQVIFFAVTYNEHEITEDSPLLIDDIRSVSACCVCPGVSADEFIQCKTWILSEREVYEDMAATLTNWVYRLPANTLLFAFDAIYAVRRIAAALSKRNIPFIPAVLWSGNTSRTYNLVQYVTADGTISPAELLQFLGVQCSPVYATHKDTKQDLVYLLELSSRYGVITERVGVADLLGPLDLAPPVVIDKPVAAERKTRIRTLKHTA
jgi:hypothetical protein